HRECGRRPRGRPRREAPLLDRRRTAPSHLSATLSPMRYGFLGPETTFTHQALLQALAEMPEEFDTTAAEMVPFASVATAATDLLAGESDALMAPIENSVEGGVSGTLDVLAATDSITIVAEQTVQISFVL